jgi:hypothetical protein
MSSLTATRFLELYFLNYITYFCFKFLFNVVNLLTRVSHGVVVKIIKIAISSLKLKLQEKKSDIIPSPLIRRVASVYRIMSH